MAVPGLMWNVSRYIHSSESLNVRYEQRLRAVLTNSEEYIKGEEKEHLWPQQRQSYAD